MTSGTTTRVSIRAATEHDLPRLWEIRYANEIAGLDDPPEPGSLPASFRHLLRHGLLQVAERDGQVAGFGGRVDRGDVAFLSDLFIDPAEQAGGIGRALLDHLFADGITARCTLASTDFRAVALYTRFGMTPRWPNLTVIVRSSRLRLDRPEVDLVETSPADAELRRWDGESGGRDRPQDLEFFAREQSGRAFWVERAGTRVGYAVMRQDAALLAPDETLTVGPVGGLTPADAADAVLASVAWASQRAPRLEIALPGPHPALPGLLAAGGQIDYIETYCASLPNMVNPERYAGSGGDLF